MKKFNKVIFTSILAIALTIPATGVFAEDATPPPSAGEGNSSSLNAFNLQSQNYTGFAAAHWRFGETSLSSNSSQDATGDTSVGTVVETKLNQSQSHSYKKNQEGAHWFTANQTADEMSSSIKASAGNGSSFAVYNNQSTENNISTDFWKTSPGDMGSTSDSNFNQFLSTYTSDGTATTKNWLKSSGKSSYGQGRESADHNTFSYQGGTASFKASLAGAGNSSGNLTGSQSNSTWMDQGMNFQTVSLMSNAYMSGIDTGTNSSASIEQMNEYDHQITNGHGYARQSGKTTTSIKSLGSLE